MLTLCQFVFDKHYNLSLFSIRLINKFFCADKLQQVELKYHLYAIVEHMGSSPTCGHYFSYIRSSPDTWHRLNDSRVIVLISVRFWFHNNRLVN